MKQRKHSFAFTLIELLVVIGIIGILAAILLPAIKAAIDRANKAQAQQEVTGISNAVKAFYNEYSRYPIPGTTTGDQSFGGTKGENKDVIQILTATETASPKKNSRNIPFLEISSTSTNKAGSFIDPWDMPYFIAIDGDYDNKLKSSVTDGYGDIGGRGVAVWSMGPGGKSADADDAKSW